MTVVREDGDGMAGTVRLEGDCPIEDAETLAGFLLEHEGASVDWSACTRMHAAVFQVLLRLRPITLGACGDPFVARWLAGHGAPRDG